MIGSHSDDQKDMLLKELVKEYKKTKRRQVNYLETGRRLGWEQLGIDTYAVAQLLQQEEYIRILDPRIGECKLTAQGIAAGS